MAVDKDDVSSGTASDSVVGETIEVHDDDIAVDLVVAEPQKPAETQADTLKGEAEPEEGDEPDEQAQEPRISSSEIKKPGLRKQMRMLERQNQEWQQAAAIAIQQRDEAYRQAQALAQRAQGADVHAVETTRHSLMNHRAALRQAHIQAAEQGDSARLADIADAMAETNARLATLPPPRQPQRPQGPFPPQQQMQHPGPQAAPRVNLTPQAQQWVENKADWIRADPSRLQQAGAFAATLQRQGFPPDDPEHYVRLDRMLKEAFDDFPVTRTGQSRGPGTVVAPASRAAPGGKKQFVVSPEDHAFLKRNGLLPNENPEGFRTWRRGREQLAAQGGVPSGAKVNTSIMIDA